MDFQLELNSETIDQIANKDPVLVEPESPTREVMRILQNRKTGAALVCRDQKLVGIFTERDALRLMASGGGFDDPIEKHMTADPVTLGSSATIQEAISKMATGGYRRLPVVDDDNGCAVGLVKVSGILRYLVEHFPKVVYTLPPKPHHITQNREGA